MHVLHAGPKGSERQNRAVPADKGTFKEPKLVYGESPNAFVISLLFLMTKQKWIKGTNTLVLFTFFGNSR